jgi:hypothetical protein
MKWVWTCLLYNGVTRITPLVHASSSSRITHEHQSQIRRYIHLRRSSPDQQNNVCVVWIAAIIRVSAHLLPTLSLVLVVGWRGGRAILWLRLVGVGDHQCDTLYLPNPRGSLEMATRSYSTEARTALQRSPRRVLEEPPEAKLLRYRAPRRLCCSYDERKVHERCQVEQCGIDYH